MTVIEKSEIINLLHQRDTYLMVDKVSHLDDDKISTVKTAHLSDPYISGHFPGAPVIPGAMLQEMCTQAAGLFITKKHCPIENYDSNKDQGWALGVLNKVNYAKFYSVSKPEIETQVDVELSSFEDSLFKFKAKVTQKGELKAKFSFNLMNIKDHYIK